MVTEVRPVQYMKEERPIVVKELPKVTEIRSLLFQEFTTRCLPVVYNYNGRKVITWFLQISIKTNI